MTASRPMCTCVALLQTNIALEIDGRKMGFFLGRPIGLLSGAMLVSGGVNHLATSDIL